MSPQLVTRKAAAEYCSCSTRHLDRAREVGELPYYNLGADKKNTRLVRIKLADLEKWLNRSRIDIGGGVS